MSIWHELTYYIDHTEVAKVHQADAGYSDKSGAAGLVRPDVHMRQPAKMHNVHIIRALGPNNG